MFEYDISKNSYSSSMNEKINQYNALVMEAEVANRDHKGQPSPEEARLYKEAMDVCSEIMNLNMSQRALYSKWKMQKDACKVKLDQILDVLDPQPVVPPRPQQSASVPAEPSGTPACSVAPQQPAQGGQNGSAVPGAQAVTKTASGFTTKNATKDVPASVIEGWYKPMPERSFDDIVGMNDVRELLEKKARIRKYKRIQDRLGLDAMQSFFFYGPPGSGKSSVIEAFAHELMEEENYKFMHLVGGDIHDSLVGVAEKKVTALFQEAIDNAPCIVFIDEIDNVCVSRTKPGVASHEKSLTVAFMEAYNRLKNSHKPVVFIGATNHPEDIDEAMLDRITLVEVPLPCEEVRKSYFDRKFKALHMEEGLTVDQMAGETDLYSFRNLDDLTDAILAEFGNQTIEANKKEDAEGKEDTDATDLAGDMAIVEGEAVLTRDLFEEKKKLNEFKTKMKAKRAENEGHQ